MRVLWLFKTFEAPKGAEEETGLLRLGTLADSDQVFINGVLVGETAYRYPPRRYQVSKGVLKTGKITLPSAWFARRGMESNTRKRA